ncbi:hypothetical protein PsYK624_113340 [Phanerochaete sordida]|uniref:JmjC domain-containing protein n=1 Tax=Phanerochaete sordida TaxID=48140 RepID=A0A9P3GHS6_9APHY|nr:hypothetical protein PsYK624_113340 [Phanerochaete sordida]
MEGLRRRLMKEEEFVNDVAMHEASTSAAALRRPPRQPATVSVQRPSAANDSPPSRISSKGWSLQSLLEHGNFEHVRRVSALLPREQLLRELERYEHDGQPLIIEDWHQHPQWPKDLFDMKWLLNKCGHHKWHIRNVRDRSDKEISLADFIHWSRDRVMYSGTENTDDVLLYGKDAPCPQKWRDWVTKSDILPSVLRPSGPTDLLQNLTESESVESLMCYLGIGDTFTPCHKDLCASSGQNIMCHTEDGGSSFWFMTASSDAPAAAEYFQTKIGQELDWEAHVVTVEEFADAPFPVYVAEQKLGDLVLVPPRSCHQVVNHGGLTVKTSWSRMTLRGLKIALHHELPIYRRVCRLEQYRVKYILYRTLLQRTAQIKALQLAPRSLDITSPSLAPSSSPGLALPSALAYTTAMSSTALAGTGGKPQDGISLLARDLADLLDMFDLVLHEEYSPEHKRLPTIYSRAASPTESDCDAVLSRAMTFSLRTPSKRQRKPAQKFDQAYEQNEAEHLANFCCDFCGSDIFQSYFECSSCRPFNAEDEDDMRSDEETRLGDGVLICPPCYVEGRTCSCTEMKPGQCRPFTDLLRDRNDAAALLSAVRRSGPPPQELQERTLQRSPRLKIFEAACRLRRMRAEASSTTRKCKCGYTGPLFEVFNCKPCHRSTCLRDLLKAGIHAAEVYLEHQGGGEEWHAMHREVRADFKGNISHLEEAERAGTVIKRKDRLVFAAQRYTACKPMNATNTQRGWYDDESECTAPGKTDAVAGGDAESHLPIAAVPQLSQTSPIQPLPTTTMSSEASVEDIISIDSADQTSTPSTPSTPAEASQALPKGDSSLVQSSPLSTVDSSSEPSRRRSSVHKQVYVCVPSRSESATKSSDSTRSASMAVSTQRDDAMGTISEEESAARQLVSALTAANSGQDPAPTSERTLPRKGRRIESRSPSSERPLAAARNDSSRPAKKRKVVGKPATGRKRADEASQTSKAGGSHVAAPDKNSSTKPILKGARGRPPGRAFSTAVAEEPAATSMIVPQVLAKNSLEPSTSLPSGRPSTVPPTLRREDSSAKTKPAAAASLDVPERATQDTDIASSPTPSAVATPCVGTQSESTSSVNPAASTLLITENKLQAPTIAVPEGGPRLLSEGSIFTLAHVQVFEDVVRRVTDTLSRRITELDEDKARESRRLAAHLDDATVRFRDVEYRLQGAEAKFREQQNVLDDVQRKAQEYKERESALREANLSLQHTIKDQNAELQKCHEDIHDLTSRLDGMRDRVDALASTVDTCNQHVERLMDATSTNPQVDLRALVEEFKSALRPEQVTNAPAENSQEQAVEDDEDILAARPMRARSPHTPPRPTSSHDDDETKSNEDDVDVPYQVANRARTPDFRPPHHQHHHSHHSHHNYHSHHSYHGQGSYRGRGSVPRGNWRPRGPYIPYYHRRHNYHHNYDHKPYRSNHNSRYNQEEGNSHSSRYHDNSKYGRHEQDTGNDQGYQSV